MEPRELDGLSTAILSFVAQLDRLGADEWSLNIVAAVTAALILLIKNRLGKLHGIDWYGFVHALITGVGSVCCLYLDCFAADLIVDGETAICCFHCHVVDVVLHGIVLTPTTYIRTV